MEKLDKAESIVELDRVESALLVIQVLREEREKRIEAERMLAATMERVLKLEAKDAKRK